MVAYDSLAEEHSETNSLQSFHSPSQSRRSFSTERKRGGRPWQPGFLTLLPVLGVAALAGYLFGAIGAATVLHSSAGKVVSTWAGGVQPSTLLSIITSVSNVLLTFSLSQGLALSFWRLCLDGTPSLAGLHYHWNAGQSLIGAFQAIVQGHGILNALALFTWTVSILRSPLNQAASTVITVDISQNDTFHLQVSQQLPDNYTGYGITLESGLPSLETSYLTDAFTSVLRSSDKHASMILEHAPCGATCDAMVNGFGFCAMCTTERKQTDAIMFEIDVQIWAQQSPGNLVNTNITTRRGFADYDVPVYHAGLNVSTRYDVDDEEYATVSVTCLLQPSIMVYPITLDDNNVVTLRGTWQDDQCKEPMNYTGPYFYTEEIDGEEHVHSSYITTIGGFQYAASNLYKSSASFDGSGTSVPIFKGSKASLYRNDTHFIDPTDDILNWIREISFRTSLYAATDKTLENTKDNTTAMLSDQTIAYTGVSTQAKYSTNYPLMAWAFALSVLAVVGITPLYFNYWRLGRNVSMSPLEIARAFDAKLLAGTWANSEAHELAKEAKKCQVLYGELRRDTVDDRSLLLAESSHVSHPKDGVVYR